MTNECTEVQNPRRNVSRYVVPLSSLLTSCTRSSAHFVLSVLPLPLQSFLASF